MKTENEIRERINNMDKLEPRFEQEKVVLLARKEILEWVLSPTPASEVCVTPNPKDVASKEVNVEKIWRCVDCSEYEKCKTGTRTKRVIDEQPITEKQPQEQGNIIKLHKRTPEETVDYLVSKYALTETTLRAFEQRLSKLEQGKAELLALVRDIKDILECMKSTMDFFEERKRDGGW